MTMKHVAATYSHFPISISFLRSFPACNGLTIDRGRRDYVFFPYCNRQSIDSSPPPSPVSFILVPPPSPGKAPNPSKPAFEPARKRAPNKAAGIMNECIAKVQKFTDSMALNLHMMHISCVILNKVSVTVYAIATSFGCISVSKYNPFQDGMVITYRSDFKARESNKI
uniref:Uncharacterized protein n=1 Tax=Glossina austeni TaxID=7395 RepID=A0A1A9VEH3_GLOAU